MEMEENKICTVSGGGAEGVIPTEFEMEMEIPSVREGRDRNE